MSGDPARVPQAAALREHTLDSEMVFRGTFLNISRDLVRLANGAQVTREYIRHSGAVMIIPLLDNGKVLMERQFRTPMQRVMVEFPAGKLDAGESWLACAQRELREETGYSAKQWAYIGPINNAISYSDETIHLAFARGPGRTWSEAWARALMPSPSSPSLLPARSVHFQSAARACAGALCAVLKSRPFSKS